METYVAGGTSYLEAKSSSNKSYRLSQCEIDEKINHTFAINAKIVTDGDDLDSLLGNPSLLAGTKISLAEPMNY